jgi:ABC-type nitrate/sulfonate/bicarbonate transport system substrate-binding protein
VPQPENINRRSFLKLGAGLAGAGLLAACGKSSSSSAGSTSTTAAAAAPMSFALSWLETVEFAGSYLAAEHGYDVANGVDVTIIPGGPNVQNLATLVNGKCLVTESGIDQTAEAIKQGAPIKMIAVLYQKNPFCVVSRAEKPIHTPSDMFGKKIGVAAGNDVAWKAFVALNKIDVSKINVLPAQFDPTPVATGEFDGQVVFVTNEVIQLNLKGIQTATLLFEDFNYHLATDAYVVRTDSLADPKARDTIVHFLRAELKGWQDAIADPTTAASLTVNKYGKNTGLALNQQLGEMNAQVPLIVDDYTKTHGLATFDAATLAPSFATLTASGVSASMAMFDTTVLPDVYQGKITL